MKTTRTHAPCNDRALCWSMRLIGLFLIVGSVFFLLKDLGLSQIDNVFFSGTTFLGLITLAGSWISARKRTLSIIQQRTSVRKMKVPQLYRASNRMAFSN